VKVLQIARQFYPSMAGVERFVLDLSRHLSRNGIQSDVLTLNRCFYLDGVLPVEDVVEGIRVTRIPYRGGQRFFWAPDVIKYISEYDVLHIHNIDFFVDFLSLTKSLHRKPIVVSTHGGFFHTSHLAIIKKVYFNLVTRLLLPRVDKVVADSEHDLALFERIYPGTKVIQNGVDFGRLADVTKQIEPGLLLYIGRMVSNKRIDLLIQCLAVLRQRVPEAQLALVGPDFEGLKDELYALAVECGVEDAVHFAGQVSDEELAQWLARAHCFVTASEYEAFGISVLEAMSTGTVPIVNPLESFQHFIDAGQNGYFTNYSQPEKAAEVIGALLRLDRDQIHSLGQKAQLSAARYSWENTVAHFIEVYNEVVNGVLEV
jgi:alpha-1,3-mannosyltransferase